MRRYVPIGAIEKALNMNKKQFILSQGATCRNWTWSWSYINETKKVIIFGAWDRFTEGNTVQILSEQWRINTRGRKSTGYDQSREHVRLIEEEGYELQTFPINYSNEKRDQDGIGPAKIKGFSKKLTKKMLTKIGDSWYASDSSLKTTLAEEVDDSEKYLEGASKTISINAYERSSKARQKCLEHYGYLCVVCNFDFKRVYGEIGDNFIHVHHIIPLAEIRNEYKLDPLTDLVPICPNCHAMIHKTQPALTIEQLKKHIQTCKST